MDADPVKIEVGDRVFVDTAWEDEQGNYHDEFATVEEITPWMGKEKYILKFEEERIDIWLKGTRWEEWQLELAEKHEEAN